MTLRNVLSNIIHGKSDYCCLCLQTVEPPAILLQDEIFFENTTKSEGIIDMLAFLLDAESMDTLSTYSAVCEKCKESLTKSYIFIKMCKESCEQLRKFVDTIFNNLSTSLPHHLNSCKSLLVCFNTSDYSEEVYYDEKRPATSQKAALKSLNMLRTKQEFQSFEFYADTMCFTPKVKSDDENEYQFDVKKTDKIKRPKAPTTLIPTSDMMLEKDSLKCRFCLKNYASPQNLRQHYFKVHAPKNFRCNVCSRTYGTKTLLEQHKDESHSPAVCSKCGKIYQNKHSLRIHEFGHLGKLICFDCGRSYKNRRTFNKHLLLKICQQKKRKSNSEAKYVCDYCQKKFCHKQTLRVHIKFEHGNGKAHVCPWCSKKFHAPSQLKSHAVKHTQEKKFPCDTCGGKFVTKASLMYHVRIHTGEKPYKCHLCEQTFLSSSRRADHVRRHHMGPSLECDFCQKKFENHSCLTRHKKIHFKSKSRLPCFEKSVEC